MTKTATVEETQPSRKRVVAATVVSTTLTVALSVGANVLISKLAQQVHDRINPKPDNDE